MLVTEMSNSAMCSREKVRKVRGDYSAPFTTISHTHTHCKLQTAVQTLEVVVNVVIDTLSWTADDVLDSLSHYTTYNQWTIGLSLMTQLLFTSHCQVHTKGTVWFLCTKSQSNKHKDLLDAGWPSSSSQLFEWEVLASYTALYWHSDFLFLCSLG